MYVKAPVNKRLRWMTSSISLLIEPDILEKLSLYAFQTDIGKVKLTLNISSSTECFDDIVSNEEGCHMYNESDHVINNLLSELTSNVSGNTVSIIATTLPLYMCCKKWPVVSLYTRSCGCGLFKTVFTAIR